MDTELPEAPLNTNESLQSPPFTIFNSDVQMRALKTCERKNTTDSVFFLIPNRNQKPEGRRKQVSLGHHLLQQSEALYS